MPGLNELMLAITHLGEETAFLAIALIVFWCVNKYEGYYLLGVGPFGNLANQFLAARKVDGNVVFVFTCHL